MKKRFTFGLQSVLDLQASKTEQARLALAHAAQRTNRQREHIAHLRRHIEEAMKAEHDRDVAAIARMKRDGTYRLRLQSELTRALRLLDALVRAESDARSELVEKRREEETLQALRTNALNEHMVEQQRLQDLEDDELGMLATNRTRKSA